MIPETERPTMPQPAYVRDNPIMAGAFASFMEWAWSQDDMHAAFCAESGMVRPTAPRNALDAMIDQATGYRTDYVEKLAAWLIRYHWGEEGDQRLEDAE